MAYFFSGLFGVAMIVDANDLRAIPCPTGNGHGPTIESKSSIANPKNSPKANTMIQSLLSEREVMRFPL